MKFVRAVMAKCCPSVRMIVKETGLDKTSLHRVLTTHLQMRKIWCKAGVEPFDSEVKRESVVNMLGCTGTP